MKAKSGYLSPVEFVILKNAGNDYKDKDQLFGVVSESMDNLDFKPIEFDRFNNEPNE